MRTSTLREAGGGLAVVLLAARNGKRIRRAAPANEAAEDDKRKRSEHLQRTRYSDDTTGESRSQVTRHFVFFTVE